MSLRPDLLLCTLTLCLGGLLGCGDEEARRAATQAALYTYNLSVRVTTDAQDPAERRPVHSVPVLIDGDVIGYTGKDGTLEAYLARRIGQQIKVEAGEMKDYVYSGDQEKTFELKAKQSEGGLETIPVSFHTEVASIRTDYLVWTKVDCSSLEVSCEDLPVKIGEEVVATTDALGRAQFTYSGTPNQTVKVVVDASTLVLGEDSGPLEEAMPTAEITLDKGATVYLVEAALTAQEIEVKEEEKAQKKTKARPRKPRHTRKVAVKKKPTKTPKKEARKPAEKKKKSSYGVPIDIFAD